MVVLSEELHESAASNFNFFFQGLFSLLILKIGWIDQCKGKKNDFEMKKIIRGDL